jgi:hypothetical protein
MLKGVDRVNWGRLTHAYGPADDVPGWLRALTARDAEARTNAIRSLHATICHQGSRYRASAPAVPFLFELLESPRTQGKEHLVELLVGLAIGYAEWHVPTGFDPVKRFAKAEQLGRRVDLDELRAAEPDEEDDWHPGRQALWMKDAYEAVLRRVRTFHRLTEHRDKPVRMAVVKALAWFPQVAKKSVRLVRKLVRGRRDPDELAQAVLTLGILDRYLQDRSDVPWLGDQLLPERPYLVRVTAAISLGVLLGRKLPDEALAVLLDVLQEPERADADGRPVAWHWLGLRGHVGAVLKLVRPKATEPVVAALCRAAEQVNDPWAGVETCWALLRATFPARAALQRDPRYGLPRLDLATVTPLQLRALRAIGRSPVWRAKPFNYGRLMDLGLEYGLPWQPNQYRTLLREAARYVQETRQRRR